MKFFLIQAVDGRVAHDFEFHLIEAINYNNWYLDEQRYVYKLCDIESISENDYKYYVPIGSVEFVLSFLRIFKDIYKVKPINIPDELNRYEYTKRKVFNSSELEDYAYLPNQKVFVKSKDKIKGYTGFITYKDIDNLKGNYLVSDFIEIDSEWRCFIYNGELVGMNNYSGDFTIIPDVELVKNMIRDYKDCSAAYTLDVGVNNREGTFIIEVHNFFSCGLYGFSDYRILCDMFIKGFEWEVERSR